MALGLLVAGCSSGSDASQAVGTPTPAISAAATPTAAPSAAVTAQPTPAKAPTATPTSSPSPLPANDFGYFPAVVSEGPPVRLSFDRAVFLTGDAANKAAASAGQQTPVDNDYFVVNNNKLLRTVRLAATVKVVGSLQLNSYAGHDVVDPQPRTVKELLGFLRTGAGPMTGFHLKYDTSGAVVRIEEQFVP